MSNIVNEKTGLEGTVDIIGMDVYEIQKPTEDMNLEDLKQVIEKNTTDIYERIKIQDKEFVVKITMGSLNNITTIIPEDLEYNDSIQVQIKISEMLHNVGIDLTGRQEAQENKQKIELTDDETMKDIVKDAVADEGTDTEDVTTPDEKSE